MNHGPPTLVILAAGMGSRYGGLKQLDAVGPHGEVLMEYSLYDARKAGVNRAVFVIRESFRSAFEEALLSRLPSDYPVDLAFQEVHDLPEGVDPGALALEHRSKPWGTGHAVWSAREKVKGPFLAINADDYYGPEAFQKLATHLSQHDTPCMVGFRLGNTLSPSGTVSRGVCRCRPGERGQTLLAGIDERTELEAVDPQTVADRKTGQAFPIDSIVSMNCWGFPHSFMPYLEQSFRSFLKALDPSDQELARAEFYLPSAVTEWRAGGKGEVLVETSEDRWLGVTYPDDKSAVMEGLRQRIAAGVYPEKLWQGAPA